MVPIAIEGCREISGLGFAPSSRASTRTFWCDDFDDRFRAAHALRELFGGAVETYGVGPVEPTEADRGHATAYRHAILVVDAGSRA